MFLERLAHVSIKSCLDLWWGDKGSKASVSIDRSLKYELGKSLPDRLARCFVARGKLVFGRDSVTGSQVAACDQFSQLVLDAHVKWWHHGSQSTDIVCSTLTIQVHSLEVKAGGSYGLIPIVINEWLARLWFS